MDAAKATKSMQPVRLTVETNQDAYLQVWKTVGSSTPQLLWPEKETGQISLKITAGQRQHIPLPMESGPVTLTARLSRVPSGPITRQEAAMFDRLSPNQLQESIIAKRSSRLTRTRHLRRQPRSIHNRPDRRRYSPRPVAAIARPNVRERPPLAYPFTVLTPHHTFTFRSSNAARVSFLMAFLSAFSPSGAAFSVSSASAYKRAASIHALLGGAVPDPHAATKTVQASAAVIGMTNRVVIVYILQC